MRINKFLLIFFSLVFIYFFKIFYDSGFFRVIHEVNFGSCVKIDNIHGPEDLVQVSDHEVLISAQKRVPNAFQDNGSILHYDLKTKKSRILWSGNDFHPHGIDFFEKKLYVINHNTKSTTVVEVFEWTESKNLKWIKTIKKSNFLNANDLSVYANDKFFITSDFGVKSEFKKNIEKFTYQKSGFLSHCTQAKCHKIFKNLFFPNGVLWEPKSQNLIFAKMLDREIVVYSWKTKKSNFISLPGAPDNISFYKDDLVVALHPNLLALKSASLGKSQAPSKIIQIKNWKQKKPKIVTLFETDGKNFSSASVGLKTQNKRLLIGSVFDNKILDCQKDKLSIF